MKALLSTENAEKVPPVAPMGRQILLRHSRIFNQAHGSLQGAAGSDPWLVAKGITLASFVKRKRRLQKPERLDKTS